MIIENWMVDNSEISYFDETSKKYVYLLDEALKLEKYKKVQKKSGMKAVELSRMVSLIRLLVLLLLEVSFLKWVFIT